MKRLALAFIAALFAASAAAQTYPTKPVRFVVPFPPGNAGDLMARMLAEKMTASMKQSIIVDNRPGAAGNIGAEHAVKSPADGYTVLIAASGIVTANAFLYKLAFDPLKDLAPITLDRPFFYAVLRLDQLDTILKRLEILQPFPALWLEHQRRDAFWQHGSVCEDYGKLGCAILAVGGWADGYTAAVFRLVENLKRPDVKGIAGPWGHLYPQRGIPGPAIGFLQECKRWWDRWLKGEQNGVENDPALRLWLQDYVPPQPHYDHRPGRWIALNGWPDGSIARASWSLNADGLAPAPGAKAALAIRSPQTNGLANGEWCPYGLGKVAPELPLDQRIDDAGSLVFDSDPLDKEMVLVGDPTAHLDIAVDRPVALVCVRLSDVAPDGQVTKVTYGLLNLTHRDGPSNPAKLEPGRRYKVKVRLNEIAHVFAPGHRLRVAVSTSCFPLTWPSPEPVTLTLHAGESRIELPFMKEGALRVVDPFAPAECAWPRPTTGIRTGSDERQIIQDLISGRITMHVWRDDGCTRIDDIGTEVAYSKLKDISIAGDDPLSMRVTVATSHAFHRADWDAKLDTRIVMTCDKTHFHLQSDVDAYADGARIFSRSRQYKIARDHL
jgi:predicted acyl esterase